MRDRRPLDVRQFIDEQPFSSFQLLVLVLCVLVVIADGFDAQAMGYVAPAVTRQLHIARSALGPVFSSSLVGMLFGSLILSPLGDRLGRKPVMLFSILFFGAASLLTATAHSLQSLLVFRLLTGLGLGGTMPNSIALNSEYMPKRLRATGIVIAGCGFSIGATLGGPVSAALIARHGWPAVFIAGGIAPIAMAAVLLALLPESIRFLVLQGGRDRKVAACLSRIAPDAAISAGMSFTIEERQDQGFVLKQLFQDGRARLTLSLWLMFFMSLLDLYFLNNWLPTVMHDAGIRLETALIITSLFQGGGTLGAITLGRLIDRSSSYRALAWAYLTAALCIFLIGAAGKTIPLLACAVFAAGFCVVGSQIGANALAAESYPTIARSTGVGWALGIGRIGSIAGPMLGGMLLSLPGGASRVFSAAAVPVLIASVSGLSAAAFHTAHKERAVSVVLAND